MRSLFFQQTFFYARPGSEYFSRMCLVAQSCLTLCDPWTAGCQTPLSMGMLQASYILESVAMSSSRFPRINTFSSQSEFMGLYN